MQQREQESANACAGEAGAQPAPVVEESADLTAQVREHREQLATILENAPGVVTAFERDCHGQSRFTFVSAGSRAVYGYSSEQILADPQLLFSRLHRDDLGPALEGIEESARNQTPLHHEYRYLHPQEGEMWHEARSTPRFNADGSIVWFALVTDVTREKRAQEALSSTRAQLDSALEAAEMGAWVMDLETNLVWASEGQRRLWEISDQTPEWFDIMVVRHKGHPDDIARSESGMAESIATGQQLAIDYRIYTSQGERWLASRARVERGPDGRARRLSGINLDITHSKGAAEAALRSQKLEALGTLSGGIAHDFNNMLSAIVGNVSLALDAVPEDSDVRSFLSEIATASERAAELVRQILAFSRPQEPQRERLKLASPVQEALRLVRATLPATIELKAELDEATPSVAVDSARIVQVVVNLCTNAAHAIGKERAGLIEVRVESLTITEPNDERVPNGNFVVLSVRDDGCGMDESTQARIFDPFFTTKAPGQGTGLGLSVVHSIVGALGGHLTVWSRPDQGAVFRIYFRAVAERPSARPPAPKPAPGGHGKRVLFVDDEPMLVKLGKLLLEKLDYHVVALDDPRAALASFREEPDSFAALVTDLAMPGLSGFELVRALRAIRSDLPVLLVSGCMGPDERIVAEQLGIEETALKPLKANQLGEILARLCGGQKARVPA